MAKIRTMTEGHPLKLIFAFSLPLMFGNVFQQFYTVVDTWWLVRRWASVRWLHSGPRTG